jgi:hypothetical protein
MSNNAPIAMRMKNDISINPAGVICRLKKNLS